MRTINVMLILIVMGCFLISSTAALNTTGIQHFLVNDTTDNHTYNGEQYPFYTCGHYTQDLIKNATEEGITMYPVYLNAKYDTDHIIATVKINNTWVFVEPINDKIYTNRELKRSYKTYQIGTHIRCSDGAALNRIRGFTEWGMF